MKRFTRKVNENDLPMGLGGDYYRFTDEYIFGENPNSPTDKLGAIEDLEEELGIDLITLFKVLNSCWFKYNFEIIGDIRPSLRFINGEWCLISNIERIAFSYPLRLYGKTWALDRKDLENE